MKVLVKGFYGHDNLGDEAILWSILRWLKLHGGSAVISAGEVTERVREVVQESGISAVLIPSGISSELRKVKEVDCILIGGGGLFPNDRPRFPFSLLVLAIVARFTGRKVAMIGLGVNPIGNRVTAIIWHLLARLCEVISVRDEQSRAALERVVGVNVASGKIKSFSDLALSLSFSSTVSVFKEKVFAIVLARPWDDAELSDPAIAERYLRLVSGLAGCVEQINAAGWRVLLVPFYLPNDSLFANRLLAALPSDAKAEVSLEKSVVGRLELLRNSSAILTMRFHGLVFGALFGKPLAVISYDHKMGNLARELAIDSYIVTLGIRESEFYGKINDVDFSSLRIAIEKILEGRSISYVERRDALVSLAKESFDAVWASIRPDR